MLDVTPGEAFLSSTQPPKSGLFFSFLLLLFSFRVNKQDRGIHSFKIQKWKNQETKHIGYVWDD